MKQVSIGFIFLLLAFSVIAKPTVPLTLEYAISQHEQEWGLMGRYGLPENHGMLFVYPTSRIIGIWMFNCFMDLSVAFLDDKKIIREIRVINAYPSKMDPKRPVKAIYDLYHYPFDDPIITFFRKHEVQSAQKSRYALEMAAGWFQQQGVHVGDKLVFDTMSRDSHLLRN